MQSREREVVFQARPNQLHDHPEKINQTERRERSKVDDRNLASRKAKTSSKNYEVRTSLDTQVEGRVLDN